MPATGTKIMMMIHADRRDDDRERTTMNDCMLLRCQLPPLLCTVARHATTTTTTTALQSYRYSAKPRTIDAIHTGTGTEYIRTNERTNKPRKGPFCFFSLLLAFRTTQARPLGGRAREQVGGGFETSPATTSSFVRLLAIYRA